MSRQILIFLLTASLLACPMRCWTAVAAPSGVQTIATTGCCGGCGQREANSTPAGKENRPADHCDCENCICHGAVQPSQTTIEACQLHDTASAGVLDAPRTPRTILLGYRDHEPGPFTGGRAARILYQSLLN